MPDLDLIKQGEQGVETAYAQIAAGALEPPIDRSGDVFHGSTTLFGEGYRD